MNFSQQNIELLRSAIAVCKICGIEAVVITNDKIAGIAPSSKLALISDFDSSFDSKIKVGIGRVNEFGNRLAIFSGANLSIEGKVNDNNDVSILTLAEGRSKVQFRCTAEKLIKYPKGNNDDEAVKIILKKSELQQLARAVKTLAAETLTLAVGKDSSVKFECSSATNEAFVTEIEAEATFINDPQALVHIYAGDRLATVLETVARDSDDCEIIVGESGSLLIFVKSHLLIVLPEANNEGEDDE